MIEGKLEDWKKKLALRQELGSGKVTIGVKEVPFTFSMNITGASLYVEFPDRIKVTYTMKQIVDDACGLYAAYLAAKKPEEEKGKA